MIPSITIIYSLKKTQISQDLSRPQHPSQLSNPFEILHRMQTKQNRAIKALYNLDYLTPTKQMHKDLKLLMVEDIGKINTLKFVHNQRNNKTPIVFKNYFIENRAIHQHNTRQTKDLHNTHANSNKKQQLIKCRGTKLWNQLPQSIRMSGGILKTFTKHVKDRIISSYN